MTAATAQATLDRRPPPEPVLDDTAIDELGLPVERTALVSIGGGLGSFALVDSLRVAGVPTDDLRVVSTIETPVDTYEARVTNSGITGADRLRSDSCSTMDNLWGFPGYALREALRERSIRPLLRIVGEPLLNDYYTPRADDLYRSVRREARRIGWTDLLRSGQAEWIRPVDEGGYVTCYRETGGRQKLLRSTSVHVACGTGRPRIPDDSKSFRAHHPDDWRVRHVYERRARPPRRPDDQPLVHVVRGDGIAAHHAIDVLLDEHERDGHDCRVVHLRRPSGNEPVRQPFNVPKATWGGQLHHRLQTADQPEADRLLERLTRTSTADRRDPRRRLDRAIESGHYRREVGTVRSIEPVADRLVLRFDRQDGDRVLACDQVIDATGMAVGVSGNELVADLLRAGAVEPTAHDRIPVAPSFAASGLASGGGEVYVSGSLAFGPSYGAPDTFLGLQFAAMAIHDDLARRGHAPRLSTGRSIAGWVRWARGRTP